MSAETFIRPRGHHYGTTDAATLTVRFRGADGKRTAVKVPRVFRYRIAEDSSRMTVQGSGGKTFLTILTTCSGVIIIDRDGNRRFGTAPSFKLIENGRTVLVG